MSTAINYFTADQARETTRKPTVDSTFARIKSKCEDGAHDLYLSVSEVTEEIKQALLEAGYNLRVGGIDDSVVIVSW